MRGGIIAKEFTEDCELPITKGKGFWLILYKIHSIALLSYYRYVLIR